MVRYFVLYYIYTTYLLFIFVLIYIIKQPVDHYYIMVINRYNLRYHMTNNIHLFYQMDIKYVLNYLKMTNIIYFWQPCNV